MRMLLTLAILISIVAVIWIGFDLFKIITKHQSKRQLYMPIIIFIIALTTALTINHENQQAAAQQTTTISSSTKNTMLVIQNELSPLKKLHAVNAITVMNNTVVINTMTPNNEITKQTINDLITAVCQKLSTKPAIISKTGINIEITSPDYTNSKSIRTGYAHVDSANLAKVTSSNLSSVVQNYENNGK